MFSPEAYPARILMAGLLIMVSQGLDIWILFSYARAGAFLACKFATRKRSDGGRSTPSSGERIDPPTPVTAVRK